MEHAAIECAQWILANVSKERPIVVVAGIGNNGGDGLAITRMLHFSGYNVKLLIIGNVKKGSPDFYSNYIIVQQRFSSVLVDDLPSIDKNTLIIDALFGTGLSRPVEGDAAEVIEKINKSAAEIISIDIPSGMPSDPVKDPESFEVMIKADTTLTLQMPKLNMLLADHGNCVGKMVILPIGISEAAMKKTQTNYFYTEANDLCDAFKPREKFAHKGVNGHVLLIAGSSGMAGAAYLAANAALKTGAGLVTVYAPSEVINALQVNSPEVICRTDLPDIDQFDCIAIGPGIGSERISTEEIIDLIKSSRKLKIPVIIDADGLNVLASNKKEWTNDLLNKVIVTPHPKEFDRLFGISKNHAERLSKASKIAADKGTIIVLKGAFTSVHIKDNVNFNSSGNPGMATAGSGDVLTGVISALYAGRDSSCSLNELVKSAVYIHGHAGDLARKSIGDILIARDIIDHLPAAVSSLTKLRHNQ